MVNAVASRQKCDETLEYLNGGSVQLNDKIQRIASIYDQNALHVLLYAYNMDLPNVTIAIIKKADDESYLKEFLYTCARVACKAQQA